MTHIARGKIVETAVLNGGRRRRGKKKENDDSGWTAKAKRIITKRRWKRRGKGNKKEKERERGGKREGERVRGREREKERERERERPSWNRYSSPCSNWIARAVLPLSLIRIYYSNQMFWESFLFVEIVARRTLQRLPILSSESPRPSSSREFNEG